MFLCIFRCAERQTSCRNPVSHAAALAGRSDGCSRLPFHCLHHRYRLQVAKEQQVTYTFDHTHLHTTDRQNRQTAKPVNVFIVVSCRKDDRGRGYDKAVDLDGGDVKQTSL